MRPCWRGAARSERWFRACSSSSARRAPPCPRATASARRSVAAGRAGVRAAVRVARARPPPHPPPRRLGGAAARRDRFRHHRKVGRRPARDRAAARDPARVAGLAPRRAASAHRDPPRGADRGALRVGRSLADGGRGGRVRAARRSALAGSHRGRAASGARAPGSRAVVRRHDALVPGDRAPRPGARDRDRGAVDSAALAGDGSRDPTARQVAGLCMVAAGVLSFVLAPHAVEVLARVPAPTAPIVAEAGDEAGGDAA